MGKVYRSQFRFVEHRVDRREEIIGTDPFDTDQSQNRLNALARLDVDQLPDCRLIVNACSGEDRMQFRDSRGSQAFDELRNVVRRSDLVRSRTMQSIIDLSDLESCRLEISLWPFEGPFMGAQLLRSENTEELLVLVRSDAFLRRTSTATRGTHNLEPSGSTSEDSSVSVWRQFPKRP